MGAQGHQEIAALDLAAFVFLHDAPKIRNDDPQDAAWLEHAPTLGDKPLTPATA
jgi:hypothetical protein